MLKTMYFQFVNLPDSVPVKFSSLGTLIVKAGDTIMWVTFSPPNWGIDSVNDFSDMVQNDVIKIEKLTFS